MGAGEGVEGVKKRGSLSAQPDFPARGPPIDWGEPVQAHDERDAMQASPDELPVIDIRRLWPVPDARHRSPGTGGLGDGLRRGKKIAIAAGRERRFEEPPPEAQAAHPEDHGSLISPKPLPKCH